MSSNFESNFRTTGTVHSYDGQSGRAIVSFSATAEDVVVSVDGMTLAQQGIDLTPDHVFSAIIDPSASTPEHVNPFGFQAMEQLRPGDTLDSLTARD